MPKQCKADNCSNPVFSTGYCLYHQHLRTDPKAMKAKDKNRKVTYGGGLYEEKPEKRVYGEVEKKAQQDHTMSMIKADEAFSLYIRLRDSDKNGNATCCTCGRVYQALNMDCGHWISRKHIATRFDERNVHAQCRDCNRYSDGKPSEFEQFIIDEHGPDVHNLLIKKAREPLKLSIEDLKEIRAKYNSKVKTLLNDK
jgi:hypothetical protein